ncbi:MAG: HlyD family secretion protein [Vulcanimicrobiota bacterium]
MPYPVDSESKSTAESYLSYQLVSVGRPALTLAAVLLVMLAGLVACLVLVPWRQTVVGKGEVTVFSPMQRPQTVDAQIKGRLQSWHVFEGELVSRGDLLCVIEDTDSKYLDPDLRLRLDNQILALENKRQAALLRLDTLESQRQNLEQASAAALPAAGEKQSQTVQKREMTRQKLLAAEQNEVTSRLNLERVEKLYAAGLRSQRDRELAEQSYVKSQTDTVALRAELDVAARDIAIAGLERQKIATEIQEEILKVRDDSLKTQESLAETDEKLEKLRNELGALAVRERLRKVLAPADGRVARLAKFGPGEAVKEGDELALIVPTTQDQAVELFFTSFDAPLVTPGSQVRLMFDGFPAVPFAAWPWAAAGTFGGTVAVVDAVDDGKSRFRVLVRPDGPWPGPDQLRVGGGATGWVMLGEVPLYYEMWRQLNAFPAVPLDDKKAKTKPVIRR